MMMLITLLTIVIFGYKNTRIENDDMEDKNNLIMLRSVQKGKK